MLKRILQKIIDFKRYSDLKTNNISIFQSNEREQADRLFRLLREERELSAIPDVFQLLLSKNADIKLRSSKILNDIMHTLNSTKIINVDKMFRNRSSYDWDYNWGNKDPGELLHPSMSEEEKVTVLGLSSFHRNGYFRERAIINLSQIKTGYELTYLLIRVNDWVKQVQNVSKKHLIRYLKPENAMNFVNNLPLVFRLRDCSRGEFDSIINSVVSMLSSIECAPQLICGLQSIDPKVRLSCYKIIMDRSVLNNKSIIGYLVKDSNPYIRIFVLRSIQKRMTFDEFVGISHLLLNDRFVQVRIFALEMLYNFRPEESVHILEKSLFDKNSSVRELARYLLSKHGKYDFASIYRDSIIKSKDIYSSICGLGETGTPADGEIIAGYLNSENTRIIKASINGLAHLDFQGYREKFISILKDSRPGVSKAARRVLYKEISASDADSIYSVFKHTIDEHVKINTCVLLCSLPKWDSIRYIIEFCANTNESVSKLGQYALVNWELKFNRSFTSPSKNQVKEIRKSIINFGKAIKDNDKKFIEFSIRDF